MPFATTISAMKTIIPPNNAEIGTELAKERPTNILPIWGAINPTYSAATPANATLMNKRVSLCFCTFTPSPVATSSPNSFTLTSLPSKNVLGIKMVNSGRLTSCQF